MDTFQIMNIEKKIKDVLDKRQPAKNKAEELIRLWRDVLDKIEYFETYCKSFQEKESMPDSIELDIVYLSNKFSGIKEKVEGEIHSLRRAVSRFSRTTINIGIAGLARQGKSIFLQKATGLSDKHIPTSNTGFCTVTKSTIEYAHKSYAIIYFYNSKEFMDEVLYPYYEELELKQVKPLSLEDFWEKPITPMLLNIASKKTLYANLKYLHDHAQDYKSLIGNEHKIITLDELEPYISRVEPCIYFAVKRAEIYAPFPLNKVSKLKLIDLPGLGELTANAQNNIVNSLQNEVDIVILIRRPDDSGDDWKDSDFEAFEKIEKAILEISSNRWLFIVLNLLANNNNRKQLDYMKDKAEKNDKLNNYNIYIVNASDKDSVHNDVLMPILDHLASTLSDMDNEYIDFLGELRKKKKEELKDTFSKFIKNEQYANLDQQERPIFQKEFNNISSMLIGKFEDIVNDYKKQNDDTDTIDEAIGGVLDAAKEIPVLSVEEIIKKRNLAGSWSKAYTDGLHICRVEMTQRLSQLDVFLENEVRKLQDRVLDTFIKVGLDKICKEFSLSKFNKLLKEFGYERLHIAVDFLLKFDLSYKNIFHYLIRKEMEAITPDTDEQKKDFPFPNDIGSQIRKEDAQYVKRILEMAYRSVLHEVGKALKSIQANSNKALFAAIEQFNDNAFRKKDVLDEEWDDLFFKYRAAIWPDIFSTLAQEAQIIEQWNKHVEHLKKCIDKLR